MKPIFTSAVILGDNIVRKPDGKNNQLRGKPSFVMSRSELIRFNQCPRRWVEGYRDDEETDEMRWGTLLDCLAIQPATFTDRFSLQPKEYPATAKKKGEEATMKDWAPQATFCKEWKAEQILAGRTIVTQKELDKANVAVKRLRADPVIDAVIKCSAPSVLVEAVYQDEKTKQMVRLHCLLDLVPKPGSDFATSLVDLKTTMDASRQSWRKTVFYQGYDVQAALYLDTWNAMKQDERLEFSHIIQESSRPYIPAKRILTSEFIEIGRLKYRRALERYCKCLATGEWPDYDSDAPRQIRGWTFTEPAQWMIDALNDEP